MTLNCNIPSFKCVVRESWFTKKPESHQVFHNCYAFAVQSVPMQMLSFHVMTDYGMLRSRVPLSEIYINPTSNDVPYYHKQLWDCFGTDICAIEYDFLVQKRCQVVLRDATRVWATYMFTVDWHNNPYSREPSDYKCGHVLRADDGYLLCQPNNRIFWRDSNWVTRDFPIEPQQMRVDTSIISVETVADRWVAQDGDNFYYDIKEQQ